VKPVFRKAHATGRGFCLSAVLVSMACLCACTVLEPATNDSGTPRANVVIPSGRLPTHISDDIIRRAVGAHPDAAKLVDAVSHAAGAPVVFGNRTTLLVDGPATFAAIRAAIASAEHTIHLETYIFADDDLGNAIQALLIEKASAGVTVRIIYDAFGSVLTDGDFFSEMEEAGIDVIQFRPLGASNVLTGKINNRDHRKLIVVDGRVAFTGGINISGVYSQSSSIGWGKQKGLANGWRDTHIQVEGPVVLQFQQLFMQTWLETGGEVDSEIDELFPQLNFTGTDMVCVVAGGQKAFESQKIYQTYSRAINGAAREILITNAYFLPNDSFLDALADAVERGVNVKIIVPGFSDSALALYASRASYERLLKDGVKIFERQDAFLHAKTAVIDGVVSIVGSANLDMRSFVHNKEISAVVLGSDFGDQLRELFETDLKNTDEITLEEWQRRSFGNRVKEWWSNLFRYWL
jgi:cardiolipin synthase A/B